MKAFLLAGGLGERLRPLTDTLPKCLAPINDVPLLAIWLDLCARHGIEQVLLNVSRHADLVARFLHERDRGVSVRLVREAHPVGNAGTVLANRDFVGRDESFYVLYADNLTDVALDRLLAFHRTHAGPLTMGLFHSPAPRTSGIVQMEADGRITRFEEKPESPAGNLANAGIYVARQALFDAIPIDRPVVDFGRDVFPSLLNQMYGYIVEGYLLDIGNPAALALGSRQWAQRRVSSHSLQG